ncbi:hypothetical protein HH308_13310 [Gordonia sp. TBRC 11910]|uniref:Mce-associated membrane protein n=1 Tax=Gordonia asplenii TaxID=2725283 RepID=A0A848KUI4_9ACTN|nr:hypothetical protein [Gordonia asplenii]NMO02190.1 hypothetical protein [Gordonia asplenii]
MTESTILRSARADAAQATSDRRRLIVALALLSVVVVLAGLVGWQAIRADAARADADAGPQLRSQAGSIVAQVLSWNGHTMTADRNRARSLVTDAYARRSGLDDPVPAEVTDQSLTFTPRTVGVGYANATSGTVLIDGTLTRTALGKRTPTPQTVTAAFVSSDGRWLVDRIDVVR